MFIKVKDSTGGQWYINTSWIDCFESIVGIDGAPGKTRLHARSGIYYSDTKAEQLYIDINNDKSTR